MARMKKTKLRTITAVVTLRVPLEFDFDAASLDDTLSAALQGPVQDAVDYAHPDDFNAYVERCLRIRVTSKEPEVAR